MLTADPKNEDIRKKVEWTAEKDRRGVPTVPSSIGVGSYEHLPHSLLELSSLLLVMSALR